MRLLRLDFGDDLYSLDLHPLVSVVSGLSAQHQLQLFEAVRRLSQGLTAGVRGLIQHQGLLIELDGQLTDPLDELSTTADPIIYIDGGSDAARLIGLQAEIDQWARQADIDSVAVEEIRADLDPSIKAKVAGLRRILDPHAGVDGESSGSSVQRLRYVSIRKAYDAASGEDRFVDVVDPGVASLLQRWHSYSELLDENTSRLSAFSNGVSRASSAVEEAEERLAAAKQAAVPVTLSSAEETRLEELSDAESDSRRGLFKKSLSPGEESERQELLNKVGANSWTEYSMMRMSPTVPPERQRAVDDANSDLSKAREELERATEAVASDRISVELSNEHEAIKAEARVHLGALVPSDIGEALTQLVDQTENPTWMSAFNELRDVLASNDLRPPYGHEPDEVLAWTKAWLRAEENIQGADADSMRPQSEAETEKIRHDLADAERYLIRHRRALARIERAELAAVASAERLARLEQQMEERSSAKSPRSAEDVLKQIRPLTDRAHNEIGGPIPFVIAGEVSELPGPEIEELMAGLEKLSDQVQVIVATTRPEASGWANEVGLKRAGLSAGVKAAL